MKTTEMLKRIQTLLNTRVELEDRKLDNGTVISADEFAEGQPVFIVTEDERIPMPIGEYNMEDGSVLVVEEEGVIAEVKAADEAEEEVEEVVEEVVEEEMSEVQEPKKVVESTVVETHFSDEQKSELVEAILSSVNPLIEELQNKVSELEAKLSIEVQEVVEEPKQELSKAFKHTPEVKSEKKQILFSQNRTVTTFDRVLSKISNK
jgi:predicted RNase H-like HicB family nuclease